MITSKKEKSFDKTYVALLDILGFKELANSNDHETLKDIYVNFDSVLRRALVLFQEKNSNGETILDFTEVKVNSLIISDSIILWTEDLKYNSFFNLLLTVRAILSEGMRCGIPLRGALVVGPLSVMEERLESNLDNLKLTCIGKSIVEAYLLAEKQSWSGCVITNEAIEEYELSILAFKASQTKYSNDRIDQALLLTSLERKLLLKKYLVPLKNERLIEKIVVNWVNEFNPKWHSSAIRNSFNKYNKPTDNWNVETIIRNTISFANDCPTQ
jgi:hypothetical protein